MPDSTDPTPPIPEAPLPAPTPEQLVADMDALLAQGRELMAKVDQFYQETGLEPGIGEKILLSDAVPVQHRVIFRSLLAELETLDQRIDQMTASNTPSAAAPSVGARAVGNRYRI